MKYLLISLLCLSLIVVDASAAEPVDFGRDIRPILSDKCFLCHGPAESTRAADLRLDVRNSAIESGALTPGNATESELIARITTDDEDLLMPPPDSNKTLSPSEKELLTRWVETGGDYQKHWAFVSPAKTNIVPSSINPVDHFIGQKLATSGLDFSPQADPRTLLRRVTFDLTGLPPTPGEINAFLSDQERRGSDVAFEAVVNRLLASSAYGERMALAWMDAARYGDTSVMHADGPRDMWPWRDWVINAYNQNMPFDQFTIEQLAGDLIPNASVEQKVASGFNRNHATSDEGGAFAEELRVEYVVDRVETTSKVWLGLTMECAQCHDHKYDPISQREYYQFFAYFNNTSDPGMQTRRGNQAPVVEVTDRDRQRRLKELHDDVAAQKAAILQYAQSVEPKFVAWADKQIVAHQSDPPASAKLADPDHWFPLDDSTGNQLRNAANGSIATLAKGKFESGKREGNSSLKLNGQTQYVCTGPPPTIEHDKPFSFAAWIKYDGKSGGAIFAKMDENAAHRGYDMWIQGANIGTHIIHQWPSNAIKVVSQEALKANSWQHVVVTYDGSQKAAGVKIYIDGKLSAGKVEQDSLTATVQSDTPFKIGSRSNGAMWKGEVDDIRIYHQALSADKVPFAKVDVIGTILATEKSKWSPQQRTTLKNHYLANEDKSYKKLVSQLATVEKQHAELDAQKTTSMIMTDNPPDRMRMTYVLDRGRYDSPKKDAAVSPGVPAALPPLPNDAQPNRLGLAVWLTKPDHPLTSRVAINRYWDMLFGEGLVRTVSDFGSQGRPPTHPELLDWLAVDFVQSGWDVKRMLKQLVMSRTYRQSSRREQQHIEKDPENLLLARNNRFRLQGEFIRDQALLISGMMVREVGGPGVKPYQPVNIWNEVSLNGGLRYSQDKGKNLYRRSMYTYWKRSAPMPNMMIFDAPTREKCVVKRARTNTPLQALVTLNDPQFVEAARALATRLIKSEIGFEERIDLAYQLATSRPASDREISILRNQLEHHRKRFAADPQAASEYLATGESARDESIDLIEHASWTVIAQMILNLDETLTRG